MPKVVPEYKQQATEKILQAAQKVFAEKGYHEARMEDIAEHVGVSKRTLYLYFKNKEELFAAMCAAAPQAMERMLQSALKTNDLLETCRAIFDIALREPVTGLNFEMIAAASRNPALRRTVRELYETETGVVERFLKDLKERGTLPRTLNSALLARALIALYDGLMADIVLGLEKSQIRETWLESTSALVRSLSAK